MIDYNKLYDDFQKEFPFEKLGEMTLDQYTNLNKSDSFSYAIEFKYINLGSIRGGSASKFGIYRYNVKPNATNSLVIDDKYAWYKKYNKKTSNEAFELVKDIIHKIAILSREEKWDEIEKIDELGDVLKWKIAFLYSEKKLIPFYSKKMLRDLSLYFGIEESKKKMGVSDYQKFLLSKKGNKDVFDFTIELLKILSKTDSGILKYLVEHGYMNNENYWFLMANPQYWKFSDISVGEEINYTLYNDLGHARRISSNFFKARIGDKVIGYEGTPNLKLVALCEVSREQDGKEIWFKKIKDVSTPIPLSELNSTPELANMEAKRCNYLGTLFKLEKEEYDKIVSLIKNDSPCLFPIEEEYTRKDFLSEVYMEEESYDKLERLILKKKNIILQGAPGVGKTFAAKRFAYSLMGVKDKTRVELVQFHQNTSYEDFIMGYKPTDDGFVLKKGVFYNFCKRAESDLNHKYFFIIDEINRGNLSKIFGELLMLIEADKRGNDKVHLSYSEDELFTVPENIYIIGMMNTADRSLAIIDYALRRRFSFFTMEPAFENQGFLEYMDEIDDSYFNRIIECIKSLNVEIEQDAALGAGYKIGHSYFCGLENAEDINTELLSIIEFDIIPTLKEYWFDDESKVIKWSKDLKDILL